ncbi:MAG: hypothetical protein EA425_13490 [Puniceicoccaceae bacterium]|nr:MAG: hypothetical protein EA425_13490 [Puniceicoccaceae bacterium]
MGGWGLGRGLHIVKVAQALNIDVVAGCDTNPHFIDAFREAIPEGRFTDNAEAFLGWDFDAVLVATYCPAHADHSILALEAGKHVLSEVTAFHTCAEGVRLVEAVERSGRVYQLGENYPWSLPNRWLAQRWRSGYFGALQYAEYSYAHDCLHLAYTYIDGTPVQPGYAVHNWRSWLPWHHYCTHSLGPVMVITGERPVEVVALPGTVRLPGHLLESPDGLGGMAPSLVRFANGGLMRNLMGSSTLDGNVQRLYGTRAASEIRDRRLSIRPGGRGHSPSLEVQPRMGELDRLAASTGHGGGDFWTLYHFANELFNGVSGPFGVHAAADVTLPGIQAYRSALEGGRPQPVPDFRILEERDRHRGDDFAPARPDPTTIAFSARVDRERAGAFTGVMKRLLAAADLWQEAVHAAECFDELADPEQVLRLADRMLDRLREIRAALTDARSLLGVESGSAGERVIREVLGRIDAERVLAPGSRQRLLKWRNDLALRLPAWEPAAGEELPAQPQLHMRRVGFETLPALELPEGFTLRSGRGESDAESWCRIIGASFAEALGAEDFRKRILEKQGYAPERHFFIVDPDGLDCATAGAFGANDEGYVHYVGTLPSHGGRKLGFWVSLAVLYCFRDRGLPSCWLTTDDVRLPALKTYHRLGFEPMITHRTHRHRWHRLAELLGIDAFRI